MADGNQLTTITRQSAVSVLGTDQIDLIKRTLPGFDIPSPPSSFIPSSPCSVLLLHVPASLHTQFDRINPPLGPWSGVVVKDRKYLKITGDRTRMPELRATSDAPRYPNAATSNGINRAQLWIDGGSNISISNLILTGHNVKGGYNPHRHQEFDHNLRIVGASNIHIDNIVAKKSNGDGVAIIAKGPWTAYGSGAIISKNITVTNSHFDGNGRQGVTVQSGDNITISRNNFNNQYYWPIDLEQHLQAKSIKNITISENTITGSTPYGFVNIATQDKLPDGSNLTNEGTANVTITKNIFSAASSSCQEFVSINGAQTANTTQARTTNVSITDNTLGINQYGVKVNNADRITVTGNTGTTRSNTTGCSTGDSSNTSAKLFGLVAAGNGVDSLLIKNNSFNKRASDADSVTTASFVQVWQAGKPTGPVKNLTNCSNNITISATKTSYDQPNVCHGDSPKLPSAPTVSAPTSGQTIQIDGDKSTHKLEAHGKASANASVTASIGSIVQKVTANSAGEWRASFTIPAGSYSLNVSQRVSGQVSQSITRSFTVVAPVQAPDDPPTTPPTTPLPTPPSQPSQPDSKQTLSLDTPSNGEGLKTPARASRMLVSFEGKATPGNYVLVTLGKTTQRLRVPTSGEWSARITLSAGQYTVQVSELHGSTVVGSIDRNFSVIK
jgi:hypothetical protein